MGLARAGKAGVCLAAWRDGRLQAADGNILTAEPEPEVTEQELAEWWLMSKGVIRGPWPASQLVAMSQAGQLSLADLVRQGGSGPWLNPSQVPELGIAPPDIPPVVEVPEISPQPAHVAPTLPDRAGTTSAGSRQPTAPMRAVPVDADALQPASRTSTTRESAAREHTARESKTSPVEKSSPAAVSTGSSPNVTQIAAFANSIPAGTVRPTQPNRTTSDRPILTRPLFRSGIEAIVGVLVSPFSIVGGRLLSDLRKLASLLLVPVAGVAVLVAIWWFWPPSTASILRDFETVHRQVETLRRSKLSEAELTDALQPQRRRIQRIVRVLEGRAGDEQSVHSELLLAGKHGLLVIVEYPRRSEMFEEMYATHLKLARMLNDGVEIQKAVPPKKPDVIGTQPASVAPTDAGTDAPQ